MRPTSRAMRGFTLVELMVAASVVAVLSGLALPSFEAPLHKARRTDALVSMMQIQSAQERFRSNGTSYGSLTEIGMAEVSASRLYLLRSSASGADAYDAFATATGAQARDSACRHLRLSAVGGNVAYASGPDPAVANPPAANRQCWML